MKLLEAAIWVFALRFKTACAGYTANRTIN